MNTPSLQIDGIIIPVIPDTDHEYTLSTAEVAIGYGISSKTLRNHKINHADELVEGKHFLGAQNMGSENLMPVTRWTKRGIVRLGFFIRSARAKRFRDIAEDLIISNAGDESPKSVPLPPVAELLLRKVAEFTIGQHGTVDDLETLVNLQRRVEDLPPSDDPLRRWIMSIVQDSLAMGHARTRLTLKDMLRELPPLPKNLKNRATALGQRLKKLSGHTYTYDSDHSVRLYQERDRHNRYWVVEMFATAPANENQSVSCN